MSTFHTTKAVAYAVVQAPSAMSTFHTTKAVAYAVVQAPYLVAPFNLSVTDITAYSARLNWEA